MKVLEKIEHLPGGLPIIAFIAGVIVKSCVPSLLDNGGFLGQIAKGHVVLIPILLICVGSRIELHKTLRVLWRGGILTLGKIAPGMIIGLLMGNSGRQFLGLSTVAIVAGMTCADGGLAWALMRRYNKLDELPSTSLRAIAIGPFLTLIVLGLGGMIGNPLKSLCYAFLPLFFGAMLGLLDSEFKKYLTEGIDVILVFMMFSLGTEIVFSNVLLSGFPGLILGLLTVFLTGISSIMADKLSGGDGIVGAAAVSTGATAIATPAAVATLVPQFAPLVYEASAQIAASVVITAILTPLVTMFVAKLNFRHRDKLINNKKENKQENIRRYDYGMGDCKKTIKRCSRE